MTTRLLALAALCAGCASNAKVVETVDAAGHEDGATGCDVTLTFDPAAPVAAPDTVVRATAHVTGFSGIPTFAWSVTQNSAAVPFTIAAPDESQIQFPATTAGVVSVAVGVGSCQSIPTDLNVLSDGSATSYRLHVVAPPAPPQERTLAFPSGTTAFSYGTFALDPGVAQAGVVRDASAAPVLAYLRFIPRARPDAYVEAFTNASGQFADVRLVDELHDVLVIPLAGTAAPQQVAFAPGTTSIVLGAGATATGHVLAPDGTTGVVGATVALTLDGVPSRSTVTTAGGAFALAYAPAAGAVVTVDVTPPAASGLPRLTATSAAFVPSTPFTIQYAAALAPRDVGGTEVARGGAGLANTRVTFAGTIATAGTITAGGTATAAGDVRASATTTAQGLIPALRVPNAPVELVVEVAAADVAVVGLDLTSAPPAVIDAPAPSAHATTLVDAQLGPIAGARVEAIPTGALAQAGVQPLATTTAATTGAFALPLATAGTYTIRVVDPGAHYAMLELADVAGATFPTTPVALATAVRVTGTIAQNGGANPVSAAAVTALCKACTGVARTRPVAETASVLDGSFALAVPDH